MNKEKKSTKTIGSKMTLREKLLKELQPDESDIPTREISVMTRLSNEVVEILDALVKLNFFRSRSEVTASIIEQRIYSNLELFKLIKKQAEKYEELQDELEDLTLKALHS